MARADQMDGRPADEHYRLMGAAMADTTGVPLVQLAWIEWSRQGDAAAVVLQLGEVRAECERLGLDGTARTLRLREIDRLGEIHTPEAVARAAAGATALLPEMGKGFQASTYLPEAWLILGDAFERAGRSAPARHCRAQAAGWIREKALPHVPAERRERFLTRNPVNRVLLS